MSITIKSSREIELMTEAGRILEIVHNELAKALHPGMSTLDIDKLGEEDVYKRQKPSVANQNGGIVHQEGPIDISNVMYIHKGKATRVGFKMDGDKKVRVAKSTGEVID